MLGFCASRGAGYQAVRPLIVISALLGAIHCARATTGNHLYDQCSAKPDADGYNTKWGLCLGYIVGVFDATALTIPLCGYDGVTHAQVSDVVLQYLYMHPAERHLQANFLVARALKEAFPCPK